MEVEYDGSSPRVWGTGHARDAAAAQHRFIPARVGNSPRRCARHARSPVHPRACGEQCLVPGDHTRDGGSSPRVWGTEPELGAGGAQDRFIPARVGNRPHPRQGSARQTVHPRACGEQAAFVPQTIEEAGSSPRVWGTVLLLLADQPAVHRFIPARVGNSPQNSPRHRPRTVHPRACGEQGARGLGLGGDGGSSPRVWGTVCPEGLGPAEFWRCQRTYRSWRGLGFQVNPVAGAGMRRASSRQSPPAPDGSDRSCGSRTPGRSARSRR